MNSPITSHHILVEAPRPELMATTSIVDGWPVAYVEASKARIKYRKYTHDYAKRSDKPWKLGERSFGRLNNALRALAVLPAGEEL